MPKAVKSSPDTQPEIEVHDAPFVVRDPKTGKSVTVKGYGALKDYDLKLSEDVDLLKPIYEQVFGPRPRKRKAR